MFEINDVSKTDNEDNSLVRSYEKMISENEEKEQKLKKREIEIRKHDELFCRKCGYIPQIDFENNKRISVTCLCQHNIYYDVSQFRQGYIYNKMEEIQKKNGKKEKEGEEVEIEEDNNDEEAKKENREENEEEREIKRAFCFKHQKEFIMFCNNCTFDICEDCYHPTHTKTEYYVEKKLINDIKDVIDEFEKNDNEEDKDMIELFKVIIKYYNRPYDNLIKLYKHPSINLIRTIEKAHKFLTDFKEHNNKNKSNILYSNTYYNNQKLIITSINELKLKIDIIKQINEINIPATNFNDLRVFEDKDFPNLEYLKLEENNITNINSLMKAHFDKLFVLNLDRNRLDNNIINNIDHFDEVFPNLSVLSLFNNYISDYDIFNKMNDKIKKLKKLMIGANNFHDETIGKIKKDLDFQKMEII